MNIITSKYFKTYWGASLVAQWLSAHVLAQGSPVWIPGADMALLDMPCCGRRPTYKLEEDGVRMLAQGQSSLAKRGGLAVVSSGLIFLETNKQKKRGG